MLMAVQLRLIVLVMSTHTATVTFLVAAVTIKSSISSAVPLIFADSFIALPRADINK